MPVKIECLEIIYPAKYLFDINYLSCQNSGCGYKFVRNTMRLGNEKKRNLSLDTIERMTCDYNILQSVLVFVSLLVSEWIYYCVFMSFTQKGFFHVVWYVIYYRMMKFRKFKAHQLQNRQICLFKYLLKHSSFSTWKKLLAYYSFVYI